MGKKNHKDERMLCCLCNCLKGSSDPHVKKLPNGTFAETECLNDKIIKDIALPAKQIVPTIKIVSLINQPETILNSLLNGIANQPMELVGDVVRQISDFAQQFLGKSIGPHGFIPTD